MQRKALWFGDFHLTSYREFYTLQFELGDRTLCVLTPVIQYQINKIWNSIRELSRDRSQDLPTESHFGRSEIEQVVGSM